MIENNEGLICTVLDGNPPIKVVISKEYYETCLDFEKILDNELRKNLILENKIC